MSNGVPTDRILRGFLSVYRGAELAIIDRLAQATKKAEHAELSAQLAEAQRLRQSVDAIARRLNSDATARALDAVQEAGHEGHQRALADLEELGRGGRTNDTIPQAQLDQVARSLTDVLTPAHLSVTRVVDDQYRRALGANIGGAIAGAETQRDAMQRVMDDFARRGITGFTDRAGRRWELSAYAEMATRTAIARASLEAYASQLRDRGVTLVRVSDSPQECPLCRPWESKVLTLDPAGEVGRIEVENFLTDEPMTITVSGTLETARAAGLFHPNCSHAVAPFKPGITKLPGNTANPEGYEARQQLRALERAVRRAKRVKAAALDRSADRAAGKEVRRIEAAIRQHVKDTEAVRLPHREKPMDGDPGRGTERLGPFRPDDEPDPLTPDLVRERQAAIQADRDRRERGDQDAEAEAERQRTEKDAAAKARRDRRNQLARDRRAKQKLEKEQRDRAQRAEQERLAREREAAARIEQERAERERVEREREAARQRAEKDALAAARRAERNQAARQRRAATQERKAAAAAADEQARQQAAQPAAATPTPTEQGPAWTVDAARVEAGAEQLERVIADVVSELVQEKWPGRTLAEVGPAARPSLMKTPGISSRIQSSIRSEIRRQYPDVSRRALDSATRQAMLFANDQMRMPDKRHSVDGRGARLLITALERDHAVSNRPWKSVVKDAKNALGDTKDEAIARDGADLDAGDGGPTAELLGKLDMIRAAGAAVHREAERRIWDRRNELSSLPEFERKQAEAQIRREVLGQIRPMAKPGDLKYRIKYPAKDAAQLDRIMQSATATYPKAWVSRANQLLKDRKGILVTDDNPRGSFNIATGLLQAGSQSEHGKHSTIVHEIGHGMESSLYQLRIAQWAYLWSRTSTGEPGSRTRDEQAEIYGGEFGYRDDLPGHYSGKTYNSGRHFTSFEIVTTGVESLFGGIRDHEGMSDFTDPDFEQFVLGAMAVL